MAFEFIKYPDEPIIQLTFDPDFSVKEHLEANLAELVALLDAAEGPCFYLIDARNLALGYEDMLAASHLTTLGEKAPLHHPNLRETVMIPGSKLQELAARGVQTASFGYVRISVHSTVEEALEYIRGKLAGA